MSAFGGKADNAAYDLVVLCEVFRDHCIGLADCASFVSGFSQNRIGDFCPHALAFGVIGLLGVAFGVFRSPRHLWVIFKGRINAAVLMRDRIDVLIRCSRFRRSVIPTRLALPIVREDPRP